MVTHESDSAIILRSIKDPYAFGEIFERHYDTIFQYLARRIGPTSGEDSASEVFLEAFRSRRRFDASAASALPWLFGITTNVLRRHARARARRTSTLERAASNTEIWFDPDVAFLVDAQTDLEIVRDVLESMDSRERELLLLAALTDLSYEEISAALGIPVGTVKSQLSRSRLRLRRKLAARPVQRHRAGNEQENRDG